MQRKTSHNRKRIVVTILVLLVFAVIFVVPSNGQNKTESNPQTQTKVVEVENGHDLQFASIENAPWQLQQLPEGLEISTLLNISSRTKEDFKFRNDAHVINGSGFLFDYVWGKDFYSDINKKIVWGGKDELEKYTNFTILDLSKDEELALVEMGVNYQGHAYIDVDVFMVSLSDYRVWQLTDTPDISEHQAQFKDDLSGIYYMEAGDNNVKELTFIFNQ